MLSLNITSTAGGLSEPSRLLRVFEVKGINFKHVRERSSTVQVVYFLRFLLSLTMCEKEADKG